MLNFNLVRDGEAEGVDRGGFRLLPRSDERSPAEKVAGGDEEKEGE